MVRILCLFCFTALITVVLSGCGSGARVEGTVTFDGAPVDGGSISFVPEGSTEAPGTGQITDGKYSIRTEKGLTPGKYKVEIYWNKKTGKEVKNPNDAGTTVEETKQVIPVRYNTKTELTVELKAGSNSGVNFDLKPGGPVDTTGHVSGASKKQAIGD